MTTPAKNSTIKISSTLFTIGLIALIAQVWSGWRYLMAITVVCELLAYIILYGGIKYKGV